MDNWKISIEHGGTVLELVLKAKSYADVYIKAGIDYPGCSVVNIRPVLPEPKVELKKKNTQLGRGSIK